MTDKSLHSCLVACIIDQICRDRTLHDMEAKSFDEIKGPERTWSRDVSFHPSEADTPAGLPRPGSRWIISRDALPELYCPCVFCVMLY